MKLRFIIYLLLIIISASSFFYYRDIILPPKPCTTVIEFSIGKFDTQFGLTQSQFVTYIEQATDPWEKVAGRELFKYSTSGNFKINLIYDERQKFTDGLEKQSTLIDKDRANFINLKNQYEALIATYYSQNSDFESQLKNFNERKADYNNRVNSFNDQGGATNIEYKNLEKERKSLETDIVNLDKIKDNLNSIVSQIKEIESTLASMAKKYNLKIQDFNLAVSLNAEEFSEGEYVSDLIGTSINVYHFDNDEKLISLLTHEFGHALGLEHVNDPDAVMYYLNNDKNLSLNNSDISELRRVCSKLKI